LLGAGASPLAADEFRSPALSVARADWRAAFDQLRAEIGTRPSVVAAFTFVSRYRLPAADPRSMPALVQLNATTSQIFTGISRSPVPVLLPFDTAAYLEARWRDAPESFSLARFQADYTIESEEEGRILKQTKENGCVFLSGNECTIYDDRPDACQRFPHVVRGNGSIASRMWQFVDRASVCPIVYNSLEAFKQHMRFRR